MSICSTFRVGALGRRRFNGKGSGGIGRSQKGAGPVIKRGQQIAGDLPAERKRGTTGCGELDLFPDGGDRSPEIS